LEQLDLEDYIKRKEMQEEKPKWTNSSYKPIKTGDLVEYYYTPASPGHQSGKRLIGLVLRVYPANVYDGASCEILEHNGNVSMFETKWVRKVT